MAVFIHVFERDPLRTRLTSDVDAAIERTELQRVINAAQKAGWTHRHTAGVDILVDEASSRARSAIHLLSAETAASTPDRTQEGILIAPVADLVTMKLTSYRLRDRVHIQDLDAVHLITPEIEAQLSETLRNRLAEIRAGE